MEQKKNSFSPGSHISMSRFNISIYIFSVFAQKNQVILLVHPEAEAGLSCLGGEKKLNHCSLLWVYLLYWQTRQLD